MRYRYETLASLDDAAAMAGWFGGTALYYPPPTLSERLDADRARSASTTSCASPSRCSCPTHLAIAAVGTLSRARLGELKQVVADWQ